MRRNNIIDVSEEVKIPGTDILLEEGDRIQVQEVNEYDIDHQDAKNILEDDYRVPESIVEVLLRGKTEDELVDIVQGL